MRGVTSPLPGACGEGVDNQPTGVSRRDVLRAAAYVPPVLIVISLKAPVAEAASGTSTSFGGGTDGGLKGGDGSSAGSFGGGGGGGGGVVGGVGSGEGLSGGGGGLSVGPTNATGGGELAYTGFNAVKIAEVGFAAAATGIAATLVGRKRQAVDVPADSMSSTTSAADIGSE